MVSSCSRKVAAASTLLVVLLVVLSQTFGSDRGELATEHASPEVWIPPPLERALATVNEMPFPGDRVTSSPKSRREALSLGTLVTRAEAVDIPSVRERFIRGVAARSKANGAVELLFVGHSHVRDLFCTLGGVSIWEAEDGQAPACRNTWEQTWKVGTITANAVFVDDPYLELTSFQPGSRRRPLGAAKNRRTAESASSSEKSFDVIVAGRGAWDAIYNNTHPVDVRMSTAAALGVLQAKLRPQNGENPAIVFALPYFFQRPSKAQFVECVVESRIQHIRQAIVEAIVDASAGGSNRTVTMFDVYELTSHFPRQASDAWGHHYTPHNGSGIRLIAEEFATAAEKRWEHRLPTGVAGDIDLGPWKSSLPSCECDRFPFHEACPVWTALFETKAFQKTSDRLNIARHLLCSMGSPTRGLQPQERSRPLLQDGVLVSKLCDAVSEKEAAKMRKQMKLSGAVMSSFTTEAAPDIYNCALLQGRHLLVNVGGSVQASQLLSTLHSAATFLQRNAFLSAIGCLCLNRTHLVDWAHLALLQRNQDHDSPDALPAHHSLGGQEIARICSAERNGFVQLVREGKQRKSLCEGIHEDDCWKHAALAIESLGQ